MLAVVTLPAIGAVAAGQVLDGDGVQVPGRAEDAELLAHVGQAGAVDAEEALRKDALGALEGRFRAGCRWRDQRRHGGGVDSRADAPRLKMRRRFSGSGSGSSPSFVLALLRFDGLGPACGQVVGTDAGGMGPGAAA